MKKLLALIVVLTFGAAFAQDDGPIRTGVNLELSGRLVALGTPELEGVRAALEQQSEVSGRPVELSVCDNQSTPKGSVLRLTDKGLVTVPQMGRLPLAKSASSST